MAASDVGGQVLAAGLVDEVRMDVIPVVFGSGKRYFGSVDAQRLLKIERRDGEAALGGRHLLDDPEVVIQASGCSTCGTRCAANRPAS